MNVSEGTKRMLRAAGVVFIVCLITAYLGMAAASGLPGINSVELLFLIVLPATLLLLAAWIVKGFAKEVPRKLDRE
jgi:positive regulator of sigma E activity